MRQLTACQSVRKRKRQRELQWGRTARDSDVSRTQQRVSGASERPPIHPTHTRGASRGRAEIGEEGPTGVSVRLGV